MSPQPGSTLGVYTIVSSIGAGGMGEVYRATDTKLNRDVAIKVLPDIFSADADRLARFTREAQTLAALNHPNIAQIFGIEESSGVRALVMEFVEGEDLSQKIAGQRARGSGLPIDDVLSIARQIADALEAAHEQGIVHRDLKPANIKVRPDGTVKVLDFGLAKAIDGPGGSSRSGGSDRLSMSPTLTNHATMQGVLIGTAAYMAPEQARGKSVDRRADIWAFGVVLYEMLTGRAPFTGETVTDIVAAVVTREVDWTALPAATPPRLRAILRDCLVRDPKLRLRDIGDARLRLAKDDDPGELAPTIDASGSVRWLWPGLTACALAAALATTALYLKKPAPEAPDLITFDFAAPDPLTTGDISPNGRQVVYRTTEPRPAQLWVRSFGAGAAAPIQNTPGAARWPVQGHVLGHATWSPDSRALVFSSGHSLLRVDPSTGQIAELIQSSPEAGLWPGAWSRDGTILYGRGDPADQPRAGIWRVSHTGGTPVQVSTLRAGEVAHAPSGFLPDGRRFLYFVLQLNTYDTSGEVRIGSLDVAPGKQDATSLLVADGPAEYAPALDASGVPSASGYLLFVLHGGLMAQPFDPKRGALTGPAIQIASGAGPAVSVSVNGRLVYRPAVEDASSWTELLHVDRSGRLLGKIGPPAVYAEVSVVDEHRLIASRTDRGQQPHAFIVDIARAAFTRLNPGNDADYSMAPSPDGTIAYTFSPGAVGLDIYVRAANGVGDARRLVTSGTMKHPSGWSPDGRFLIFDDHVPGRAQDLLIVSKDGGAPIPFLTTDANETLGQFSPDGKWIAYHSSESGRAEIYVRDFAADKRPAFGKEKVQISVGGGDKPRWSRDGREIFFIQNGKMMAAPVRPGTPFQIGAAVALFDVRTSGYVPYDVMRDGTFIINTPLDTQATVAPPLRVLLNWQAALRK